MPLFKIFVEVFVIPALVVIPAKAGIQIMDSRLTSCGNDNFKFDRVYLPLLIRHAHLTQTQFATILADVLRGGP